MEDIFNELFGDTITALDSLNHYSFEFGISSENGQKKVEVSILNTDSSITSTFMSIADIMYFTEYGTMTIPGKFVLEKMLFKINDYIHHELELIIDSIFDNDLNENDIYSKLFFLSNTIEIQCKQMIRNFLLDSNTLGNLLKQEDENQYLYKLDRLSQYITCKLVKK